MSADALEALYAELPVIECKKLCQDFCGPVAMSALEWERIKQAMGYTPKGTADLMCPMLDRETGSCQVYALRPMICRLWGVVRKMQCPYGCYPKGGYLSDKQAYDFLNRADEAGRDLE